MATYKKEVTVTYIGPKKELKNATALAQFPEDPSTNVCLVQFDDRSLGKYAFDWHPIALHNVRLLDPQVDRHLTKDAKARITDAENTLPNDGICYCNVCTMPPCSNCENHNSPMNIREDDESWEISCRDCGGLFEEQPIDGRCDYSDCPGPWK